MKKTTRTTQQLIAEGKVAPHYAVAKSTGDAPVQAWIALLPGWQGARAARIDAIVAATCPGVAKAVRWHGAWYGTPGGGWFLALNSFKAHLKLTFFDGQRLTPPLPVAMKTAPNGALDLRETDPLDADRIAAWIRQASRLPGYGKV